MFLTFFDRKNLEDDAFDLHALKRSFSIAKAGGEG